MKKYILALSLIVIFSFKAFTQTDTTSTWYDDEQYDFPRSKLDVKVKYLSGFDKGFVTFMDNGKFSLSPANDDFTLIFEKSSNLRLRVLNAHIQLAGEALMLKTGAELDWNNYRFRRNITLQPNQPSVTVVQEPIDFKKNKLLARYIIFPLTLQSVVGNTNFKLEAGAEFNFLLDGKTKQVSDDRGKVKVRNDFNLNPYRVSFVGRIGFKSTILYARYHPKSVFAENQGPDLSTFSIGFGVGGF